MTLMRTQRIAVCICAIVAPTIARPQTGRAQTIRPELPKGSRVLRDLPYVDAGHARQKLDLYLPPEGEGWPLIVWIHGGAWRGGSKERSPALQYVHDGYAVASINYRLSQHATFPAQLHDCKGAIRWLRAHARAYGYNPRKIGVWGASAGGHLAALVGVTGDVEEFDIGAYTDPSSRVQAVVDFFGPTDFLQMNAQAGEKGRLDHDVPDSPESRLIGGPIHENKQKVLRANPITYVSAGDPPILIMHGEDDYTVPIGQSELLHAACQKVGVRTTFVRIPDAGHGFRSREIDESVRSFFDQHLK